MTSIGFGSGGFVRPGRTSCIKHVTVDWCGVPVRLMTTGTMCTSHPLPVFSQGMHEQFI